MGYSKVSNQILCFLFGIVLKSVFTYRTGAPTRACGDMTPLHGSPINTDPAPYLVEVSKTQYAPNERIYVRIRGCGLAKFKGFMIQPRSAMYPNRPAFLGAFLRVRGTRYECVRSGAVLTHSSSDEKDSVTLTWIAPPGAAGHVVFRVTFVQSYSNYWVGINSPVVYDGVSHDLTIMQAFSLQSATDQSCLPTRTTTRRTTARPTTESSTTTTSAPTTPLPTLPPEYYYTTTSKRQIPTTTQEVTTTTTRPTTTTTRQTTTFATTTLPSITTTTTKSIPTTATTESKPTTTTTESIPTTTTTESIPTTTTTVSIPTTTVPVTTTLSTTLKPTTAAPQKITDPYYYDYYEIETSTRRRQTTTAEPTTTATTITTTSATTTKVPTTTTGVAPTTTSSATTTTVQTPTEPIFIYEQTTLSTTTTPKATTSNSLAMSTTAANTELTTTQYNYLPKQDSVTTKLYPDTQKKFSTTLAEFTESQTTRRFLPTYPPTQNLPTTKEVKQETTRRLLPTSPRTQSVPTTGQQATVTVRRFLPTYPPTQNLPTTRLQESTTHNQKPTTHVRIRTEKMWPSTTKTPALNSVTNLYEFEETTQSKTTTHSPVARTDAYFPKTTYYYDYDMGNMKTPSPHSDQQYVKSDQKYISSEQMYKPTKNEYIPDVRNDTQYAPTTYRMYIPTTQIPVVKESTIGQLNPTTRRTIHVPTTYTNHGIPAKDSVYHGYPQFDSATKQNTVRPQTSYPVYEPTLRPGMTYTPTSYPAYNPTFKQDAHLTFPPQTQTPKHGIDNGQTPSTTVFAPTSARTVLKTTTSAEVLLNADADCGVTKGCFDDCRNGVCNYIVSWSPEKDSTVFEIKTKPMIVGQYWTAIGFSNDTMMGFDSVTECITEGEKIEVYQSYNLDYYRNMKLLKPKLGIQEEQGSTNNGIFQCRFKRKNFVDGEKEVFDLNKDWFMMFADGPAVNGVKIPHRYDIVPPVTSERIDLQRYPPMHESYDYRPKQRKENIKTIEPAREPVLVSVQQRRLTMDEDCGSKKSCFQDCTDQGCKFIVSWVNADDHVTFKIKAVLNGSLNQWIAIAFSEDNKMGEDSVIQCVSNDEGFVRIGHSYNDGKNNIKVAKAEMGLRNSSARFVDGIFECDFMRDRYVENEQIFNLDRSWNVHFAHGKSKNGIMLPHTMAEIPHVSDNSVDFSRSAPSLITASHFFIKVHAALMIFAWILGASVASVIGRYFQPFWWGEKMFGSKTWVKVHWLFVLITCAAVIAGFSVIFVGVDGISQLYEHPTFTFNGTHPIMGLVVALLALLNPLLLCLRPSEDSSSRAFFNCMYWLVEIGAHVLAIVTIYAGFGLASFLVPSFFTFLIIGFTVYQILVLLFMEALKSYDAKKTIERKKMYLYEMQVRPWNSRTKNNTMAAYMDLTHTSKGLKNSVLAAHLILLSALTSTMIVIIVINDKYT